MTQTSKRKKRSWQRQEPGMIQKSKLLYFSECLLKINWQIRRLRFGIALPTLPRVTQAKQEGSMHIYQSPSGKSFSTPMERNSPNVLWKLIHPKTFSSRICLIWSLRLKSQENKIQIPEFKVSKLLIRLTIF